MLKRSLEDLIFQSIKSLIYCHYILFVVLKRMDPNDFCSSAIKQVQIMMDCHQICHEKHRQKDSEPDLPETENLWHDAAER